MADAVFTVNRKHVGRVVDAFIATQVATVQVSLTKDPTLARVGLRNFPVGSPTADVLARIIKEVSSAQ